MYQYFRAWWLTSCYYTKNNEYTLKYHLGYYQKRTTVPCDLCLLHPISIFVQGDHYLSFLVFFYIPQWLLTFLTPYAFSSISLEGFLIYSLLTICSWVLGWDATENRKISGRRQWSNKSYPIFVMDKQIEIFGRRWRQFEEKDEDSEKIKKRCIHGYCSLYDSLPGRHKHSILSSSEVTKQCMHVLDLGKAQQYYHESNCYLPHGSFLMRWTQKGFSENRAKRNKSSESVSKCCYTLHYT